MNALVRFLRLPAWKKRLMLEALAGLSASGMLIHLWPFRRLAARLGRHMAESPADQTAGTRALARQIQWAIAAVARRLPWHPVCLPQALTAQWMLRRHGVPSTLYLGVDPASQYDAHAWVRAGYVIVTGGPVRPEFVVVASFA